MRGAGAARVAQYVDVKAARASDHVLAIFPSVPGQRKCLIPFEGGVHPVELVYRGVCRTSVQSGTPTVVAFTERWLPCLKGQDCMAGMRLRRHSWLVTMGPLTVQSGGHHYKKPAVESSEQRGDQPPQGPRP
jgi:hypothetical protein